MGSEAAPNAPLLEIRQLVKSFPGTIAVDTVDFVCRSGEIHGLVGENGAGKSTLIKVLAGIYRPDRGKILINGIEKKFKSYSDARRSGIGVVYQELSLLPELSVAENIYMGNWPRKTAGLIDWEEVYNRSRAILSEIGVNIDPNELVASLPMALRQMVEIAKVLTQNPDILVFDEPTAALSKDEVESLFSILRDLKEKKKGLIFVSHRLDEVLEISDTITVMKDGQKVISANSCLFDEDKLISSMIGRDFTEVFPAKRESRDKLVRVFAFKAVLKKFQKKVAFSLCKGEVLGVGGLQGQGQIELLESIFGLGHCTDAFVTINDKLFSVGNPVQAMRSGIALVPENRNEQGVFLVLSALQNLAAASIDHRQRLGFIQKRREKRVVGEMIERLSIKVSS
jgi:ribose transport system ATP-binding protein